MDAASMLSTFALGEQTTDERIVGVKRPRYQSTRHEASVEELGDSDDYEESDVDDTMDTMDTMDEGTSDASTDNAHLDAMLAGASWSALYHGMSKWLHCPPTDDQERSARKGLVRYWRLLIGCDASYSFVPHYLSMSDDVRRSFVELLNRLDRL